ncbi:hypothetical protein QWJ34_10110 [Saccharibacillus sp. CPCC 101409]|uniref:hypothetical protein n=1 Tax=Saccharibacillus sp. CPCC 101409 TaxID=3058041 RepID=UPI002671D4A2|nr:hypothetical protein [Saccharibacillus sp. CPCC 101409]MDO3410115.1 hypothetical protein [Saccharibacillus sp. CPCC 101409]
MSKEMLTAGQHFSETSGLWTKMLTQCTHLGREIAKNVGYSQKCGPKVSILLSPFFFAGNADQACIFSVDQK